MLTSRIDLEGAVVFDLFAGTGSLGIEALSRGAAHCTFVERSHRAVASIEENCRALNVESERYSIVRADACAFVERATVVVDLVFADPPYASTDLLQLLATLEKSACVRQSTIVVIEHVSSARVPAGETLSILAHRQWGETACTMLVRQ